MRFPVPPQSRQKTRRLERELHCQLHGTRAIRSARDLARTDSRNELSAGIPDLRMLRRENPTLDVPQMGVLSTKQRRSSHSQDPNVHPFPKGERCPLLKCATGSTNLLRSPDLQAPSHHKTHKLKAELNGRLQLPRIARAQRTRYPSRSRTA